MIFLSYVLNIIVLIPVCAGLLISHPRMDPVFGARSTAREILTCMYLTILFVSSICLIRGDMSVSTAQSLFGFQIMYKLLTLIVIRNKKAPVYWFNGAIALFHGVTLTL